MNNFDMEAIENEDTKDEDKKVKSNFKFFNLCNFTPHGSKFANQEFGLYWIPELIKGTNITEKSDVFLFGVIAAELMSESSQLKDAASMNQSQIFKKVKDIKNDSCL